MTSGGSIPLHYSVGLCDCSSFARVVGLCYSILVTSVMAFPPLSSFPFTLKEDSIYQQNMFAKPMFKTVVFNSFLMKF